MLPFTAFDPAHLRSFSYVVPNDDNDMHTGSSKAAQIKAGDAWLKAHVPAMLAGGAEVIVTWDEGTRSNEHIATIAIGGTAKQGAKDAVRLHPLRPPGRARGRLRRTASERGPDRDAGTAPLGENRGQSPKGGDSPHEPGQSRRTGLPRFSRA